MAGIIQYEIVAVMQNGDIRRSHSTDWFKIDREYSGISEYLYKVLWQHYDHEAMRPVVRRSASMAGR